MTPSNPSLMVRQAVGPALLLGLVAGSPAAAGEGRLLAPDDPVLADKLEQAGWTAQRQPGGDLLIRSVSRETEGASAAAAGSPRGDALEAVAERLRGLGWEMSRDARGNIFLRPVRPGGGPKETPAAQRPPASGPSGAEGGAGPLDVLAKRLVAAGWAVEPDAGGGLRVYPPAEAREDAPPPHQRVTPPLSPALAGRLEAAGWGVEREGDGSIRLIPAGPEEAASSGSRQQAGNMGAERGVDTWQDAHDVARAWLSSAGDEGLAVGKIRRLHRIYVVSVVSAGPPFRLENQLIIRRRDAKVIAVE